ncbi:MAG: precorrin-6y C5,15-methyltransferase (decarboxylating) subunit CbiE [Desulfovibrio sp.]|nr:MAG: precorrin-6y C5,15-methyltransferase (decarboxylating) subunit CbiE [Desulfovibrio sp.]
MPILVVGLGLDPDNLPEQHVGHIEHATVLVGGKRQLAAFEDHPAEKIEITSPLSRILEQIKEAENNRLDVVVLADGDPLFFGIGNTLVRELGPDHVTVLPNVTSVQTAAARLKIPLQDIRTVSLHGRGDFRPLLSALLADKWVAVLTDADNVPSALAQSLLDKGVDYYTMWVFEDLESGKEKVASYSLEQAAHTTFSRLNIVIFERRGDPEVALGLGIPDHEFARERNLITKQPVRAAGLAALRLHAGHTVWDLGAGCGAVGVEASVLACRGRVYAVEKKGERVSHIRENARRMGALLVEPVHGTMPACLADLPDPDRIFVGGGLGRSSEVLEAACDRLVSGGRIVVHCVLFSSLAQARQTFETLGWPHEVTMVHPSLGEALGGDMRLKAENPVFIVAADKVEGSGKAGQGGGDA